MKRRTTVESETVEKQTPIYQAGRAENARRWRQRVQCQYQDLNTQQSNTTDPDYDEKLPKTTKYYQKRRAAKTGRVLFSPKAEISVLRRGFVSTPVPTRSTTATRVTNRNNTKKKRAEFSLARRPKF